MLLNKGKITAEQLDAATRSGHNRGRRIGETLVALGYVTEWDIAECLAEQFDFKVVDPSTLIPSEYALSLLTPEVALSHKVLMLRSSEDAVECVMSDPIDFPTSDMIANIAGKRTCISLAPASALLRPGAGHFADRQTSRANKDAEAAEDSKGSRSYPRAARGL